MQNPDVTRPAGAGDVPEANYKMIAALGVKRGEIERTAIADFVKEHGMTGWAPTQGHIPSGVPYLGFAREDIMSGKVNRTMIIGKGSLFLGRMTNLFDGVSIIIEANDGKGTADSTINEEKIKIAKDMKSFAAEALETAEFGKKPVIGITAEGSEHGIDNIYQAARLAEKMGCKVIILEGEDIHKKMEDMLDSGELDGAVTMHYSFPIGVSTVGKFITPGMGREMYLATTTGISDTDRVISLVKNAIYGIIAAKASGIANPTVGIANIDGARQCEKILLKLKENGYDIGFAESARAEGGIVMRGNDLLMGTPDVMVMDSLTGNLMMKIFSAYTTGGNYEALGWGYGPGIGEDYSKIIMIISRASGAPVIAGAVAYASEIIKNNVRKITAEEFEKANKAGLKELLNSLKQKKPADGADYHEVKEPPKEIVTAQIPGIEVMDLEDAVTALWKEKIYAESGMGCTGPIVRISDSNKLKAESILINKGFIK